MKRAGEESFPIVEISRLARINLMGLLYIYN